jgi:septum formation protein
LGLILASGSPRRLDLLRQVGLEPAQVLPADIDETPRPRELPRSLVLRLAEAKARLVAASHPDDYVLGADTEVALAAASWAKPRRQRAPPTISACCRAAAIACGAGSA